MEKGSRLPLHSHPQKQTRRLFKGRIILVIGNEKMGMNAGDGWRVPGNPEHGADVSEESIAGEIFSPLREEYRQYHCG
jgi:quercetin dioxygenase-like cupin family protein